MKRLNILVACEYSGAVRQRLRDAGHNAFSCDLLPADDGSPYHYTGDCFDLIETGRLPSLFGFSRNVIDPLHQLPRSVMRRDALPAEKWDMLIAFPPCTYLTVSGAWLFAERDQIKRKVAPDVLTGAERRRARADAVEFVKRLYNCGIPRVAIENPSRSFLCTMWRKPDQVVHPWEYGDDASKSTGLWLRGLEPLRARPHLHVAPRMVMGPSGKQLPRWANQTDSGQNVEPPAADRWKKRSDTWPGIADAMVEDFLFWVWLQSAEVLS